MSDDPWMKELGTVARDERAAPLAGAPGDLVRPLSAAELDGIASRAADAVGGARVVPLRAPRRRWAVPAILAAAVAAAAAAMVIVRSDDGGDAIATYDLVVEGGARAARSGEPADGPVRVARGGHLTILLRPRAPASRSVGARAFVEHGGAIDPWMASAEVSPEGVVRLDADEAAIAALPRGDARIVVFVGSPSHLPADGASARRAREAPAKSVQSLAFDAQLL